MSNIQRLLSSIEMSEYISDFIGEQFIIKIHSVFPNGFNVQTKDNLIFISKHPVPLSAYGLNISAEAFDKIISSIKVDQTVRVKDKELTFYTKPTTYILKITNSEIRDLTPPSISKDLLLESKLRERLEKLQLFEETGFAQSDKLKEYYHQWIKSKEDHENLIPSLIGAGVGLTPTGDDFLQGNLLMEKVLSMPPVLRDCVEKNLKASKTTDVSSAYYKALLSGQVNEMWVQLFDFIKKKEWHQIDQQLFKIKNYGHTSGYDLLIGMLSYIHSIE